VRAYTRYWGPGASPPDGWREAEANSSPPTFTADHVIDNNFFTDDDNHTSTAALVDTNSDYAATYNNFTSSFGTQTSTSPTQEKSIPLSIFAQQQPQGRLPRRSISEDYITGMPWMNENAPHTMAGSLEKTHHSSSEGSHDEGYNVGFATNQLQWGTATQNMPNADQNSSQVYTDETSSSHCSNHSSRSMSAYAHIHGAMPKSNSCPDFAFKMPLSRLQMVTEDTHRPTLPLTPIALQHKTNEGKVVESMDYRDSSWQGRSDEHSGCTPYVKFADFPSIKEMLQEMRDDPESQTPDTATIFASIEQVQEWREKERVKGSRGHKIQDNNELPKTKEEKAAIVKLLFKAFKTTVEGQSNQNVQIAFENQVHSNAFVEAVCWQLLEAAILRSKGGPLSNAYEQGNKTKSAKDKESGFADRVDALIQALMWEKSVCNNLLKAPKVEDAVDSPNYIGKRTANNRTLNGKKAEVAKLGKEKMKELEAANGDVVKTTRGPKKGKRTKAEFEDGDSESTEESSSKRRSPERNVYSTPRHGRTNRASGRIGYPGQITPTSSQRFSHNSTPSVLSASPAPSTTASIRAHVNGYNLNGIPPLDFGGQHPRVPPSPLRQPAMLAEIGAQMAPPPLDTSYGNSFTPVNRNSGDFNKGEYTPNVDW
jgi:hypothetical protein